MGQFSLVYIFVVGVLVLETDARDQICYTQVTSSVSYITYVTRVKYITQRYTSSCGLLWLSRCGRYRSETRMTEMPVTRYRVQYQAVKKCCENYHGTYPTCTPICTPNCVHGTCTSPGLCTCTPGWTGSTCDTAICSTKCIHGRCTSPGLYTCTNGWTGSTCDTAIRNCATDNGGCEQRCTNTHGSYRCTCNAGYLLSGDKHTCGDINECATNNGGCAQTCINNIGSYRCSCRTGYTLDTDRHSCIASSTAQSTSATDEGLSIVGKWVQTVLFSLLGVVGFTVVAAGGTCTLCVCIIKFRHC